MRIFLAFFFSSELILSYCYAKYYVNITHNGPVVLGATITFKAEVFLINGDRPKDEFTYYWKDYAIPPHTGQTKGSDAVSYWDVSYPASKGYVPGPYEVEVAVRTSWWGKTITSRSQFELTLTLNGDLDVIQSGRTVAGSFISNEEAVKHQVVLSPPDLKYVSHAPQVYSFWYVDCVYSGFSEGYDFAFNFPPEDKTHNVEVLVMISFEPLPTPEPSTTTTTTTTSTTTTTIAPTTTTSAPNSTTTSAPNSTTTSAPNSTTTPTPTTSTSTKSATTTTVKSVNDSGRLLAKQMLMTNLIADVPYICMNSSIIPPDPKKIYGYFRRKLIVRAPVTNVIIKGTNWLKHGDMMNLQITCNGSGPYYHCAHIVPGLYNATGNETCHPGEAFSVGYCVFPYMHYFSLPSTYTVLIIIGNDINVKVTQVAVNVYEVTKKAQLSVIVVPVVCSIVAVILIVFGVAYYVQNRRRFIIEVADFQFGHVNADMEYKTFNERLKEAIMNAFIRSISDDYISDSDSESDRRTGGVQWPQRGVGNAAGPSSSGMAGDKSGIGREDAPGHSYGSME